MKQLPLYIDAQCKKNKKGHSGFMSNLLAAQSLICFLISTTTRIDNKTGGGEDQR
jgi:hypothetical protein